MKGTRRLASGWMFFAILITAVGWFSAFPTPAQAQGSGVQGQNAVYSSSGACCQGSSAFIDASKFVQTGVDFCKVLNGILSGTSTSYPATGAVIDARGLNSANTSMTCTTAKPSPWAGITSPPPSTILLPATGGTPIIIPSTWILPSNTHLIGEGDGIPSTNFAPGTTLRAATSFSGAMIQLAGNLGTDGTYPGYFLPMREP